MHQSIITMRHLPIVESFLLFFQTNVACFDHTFTNMEPPMRQTRTLSGSHSVVLVCRRACTKKKDDFSHQFAFDTSCRLRGRVVALFVGSMMFRCCRTTMHLLVVMLPFFHEYHGAVAIQQPAAGVAKKPSSSPSRRSFLFETTAITGWLVAPRPSWARGLVKFPCKTPLSNTYHLMRAGTSMLEEEGRLRTARWPIGLESHLWTL
jgi:hypothetical protein